MATSRNYDNWRKRIRDHFVGANMYYKDVFHIIEKEKNVISWNALNLTKNPRLPNRKWALGGLTRLVIDWQVYDR